MFLIHKEILELGVDTISTRIQHSHRKNGGLAQLARAPALHAGGHRFDSDILHKIVSR